MDIKSHVAPGAAQYVNYSVVDGDGGAPYRQDGFLSGVFPYDVSVDVVPGLVNGTGILNGSEGIYVYDVNMPVSNGSNITNASCGVNETCSDFNKDIAMMPMWQVGFFGFLACVTIIVTIVGNIIVILSFVLERQIRQPTNYFIASLAMSDLLIGTISMPFYTVYLLSGQRWLLGVNLCDLWLAVDYTVCLTSIYTVFAITIDRFCSVKIPAKYRNWRTERKVVVIISLTWIIPVLLFFTSIFGWQYIVGERTIPEEMCYVQYLEEAIFNCILQVSYFWITLTVMCTLYTGIYKVALDLQRRSNAKRNKMTSLVSMAGQTMTRIGIGMSQQAAVDARKLFDQQTDNSFTPMSVTPTVQHSRTTDNKANNNHGASTTSFTSLKNPDNPDDRSSSPAFPSDTDPSSQSPKTSPQARRGNTDTSKTHKRKRLKNNTDLESSFKLQNPPKGKRSHRQKQTHGSQAASEEKQEKSNNNEETPAENNTDLRSPNENHGDAEGDTDPLTPPPLPSEDVPMLLDHIQDVDLTTNIHSATCHQPDITGNPGTDNPGAEVQSDMFPEVKYIDQDSLKSPQSNDNLRTLSEAAKTLANSTQEPDILEDPESPVWKMRESVIIRNKNSLNSSPVKSSQALLCTPGGSKCVTEPITPCTTSMLDSAEPSLVFSPSPNHHEPAALQVQTRGADSRPVTKLAKGSSDRKSSKKARKEEAAAAAAGGSPLTSIVKNLKRSKRSKAKNKEKQQAKQSRSENRARKALRTITIILGAFVLCWTPWHVLSMILGFTPEDQRGIVLLKLYDISYWLCYLNSPINPFCYAMANAQFKKTFIRIIKLDWHRS